MQAAKTWLQEIKHANNDIVLIGVESDVPCTRATILQSGVRVKSFNEGAMIMDMRGKMLTMVQQASSGPLQSFHIAAPYHMPPSLKQLQAAYAAMRTEDRPDPPTPMTLQYVLRDSNMDEVLDQAWQLLTQMSMCGFSHNYVEAMCTSEECALAIWSLAEDLKGSEAVQPANIRRPAARADEYLWGSANLQEPWQRSSHKKAISVRALDTLKYVVPQWSCISMNTQAIFLLMMEMP